MDDAVTFSQDGGIARLTFNRPQKLNALSPDLISQALAISQKVAQSDARVLIVAGAGKAFSAGVDLQAASAPGRTREDAKRFSDEARQLEACWESSPQVVIARVTGYCFTGGLELALACDFIVASQDAQFCDTHAKVGLRPGWGLSARLPRRIGVQRAREMSFTARRMNADEAVRIGLILEAVPLDELDARIDQIADQVVANSAGAIAAYKDMYRKSQNMTLDDNLAYEATATYRIADARSRQSATISKLSGKSN